MVQLFINLFYFLKSNKAKRSIKVSFIIYSSAKFFSTNKTDNSALNCNAKQQISNNVISISPINGIGNQVNLVTSTFEIQQVFIRINILHIEIYELNNLKSSLRINVLTNRP